MLQHVTHSKECFHSWNHDFIKSPFRCNFRLTPSNRCINNGHFLTQNFCINVLLRARELLDHKIFILRETEMVRTPFYDKNGLKKGAWSVEEDNKLRAYIQRFGHWNWRELPKVAGI